ncbi:hypothetical protein NKH18_40965 [Streptomyces sp. M10(2022)]
MPATELVTIAGVEQELDPLLPGDHVHTRLTLTTDLLHRYRRTTVRVRGNVVAATHGESREEPIGNGDADLINQTFALWQAPLTWLPADNPLGPPRPSTYGSTDCCGTGWTASPDAARASGSTSAVRRAAGRR